MVFTHKIVCRKSPKLYASYHNQTPQKTCFNLTEKAAFNLPNNNQATLPNILHSEIPYQSINLMIIIHIFCYNCCILIFLLSWCHSPFHLSFSIRTPCFRAPFTIFQLTNCQYIHNVPSAPYQTSPCLLSTGA